MGPVVPSDSVEVLAMWGMVLCGLIALGLLIALVRVWVVIADLRLRRKVLQRGCIGCEVPPGYRRS